jgi:hypothetical protein
MNKICTVPGCNNRMKGRGYCPKHLERLRVHGDVNAYFPNRKTGGPCSVEGCDRFVIANGLCQMHYARVFRHGDTNSRLPTYGSGRIVHEDGYVRIRIGNEYVMEHVLVATVALGKSLPEKAVVHHMNEDPADNFTPFNLIICPDQKYHALLHKRMREFKKYGKCFSTE